MSLIEQAAGRLEQLRKADGDAPAAAPGQEAAHVSTIEAAMRRADKDAGAAPPAQPPAAAPPQPAARVNAPRATTKRVELDLKALGRANLLMPSAGRTRLSEEYRIIKRPLIDNAMGKNGVSIKNGNLIMLTSALPGEGKTFCAVNLALSIAAEVGTTVMLVDADVARPSVLNVLGLPPGPGLLDILTDERIDIPDVLLRTNIENLSILPGGTQKGHATELLASVRMANLVNEIAQRYPDRIVVFDSPPLLLTTESRVLATHMGQIVLVVRAESTTHSQVQQALASIESCEIKLLLLNQARYQVGDGYGYGYDYGYAGSQA